MTDFSAPCFWRRISSWRASMPQTSIWAPLFHKITMGQIIGSDLLFKPMLPAKSLDTCNTIDNHNAGVSPSSSLTTSLRCNLQPRVCHLCWNAKLVPDWGKRDGVKSESRSVPMAESNIATVADVLTNPPGTCLCLAASVWHAPSYDGKKFRDGPNAPFNKRPVCGVKRCAGP